MGWDVFSIKLRHEKVNLLVIKLNYTIDETL